MRWRKINFCVVTACVRFSVSVCIHSHLGLVVPCDPRAGDDHLLSKELSKHILETAAQHTHTSPITHESFIELIRIASLIRVQLDSDAHVLLESFYTGSRRVRMNGLEMPITALDSL